MKSLGLSQGTLAMGLASALLAGCGGSQPPIGAPGAMQQSAGIVAPESAAAAHTIEHGVVPASSYHVLHSFGGGEGAAHPRAGLTNVHGTLYGTTYGSSLCCGTVYSIRTTGTEKQLYRFRGGADGSDPGADLINVNGTLYGTTFAGGGAGCYSSGCGTVFSVTTTGEEKVLHAFAGGSDGANPAASLINVEGTLYGTTQEGGANRDGTVFSITTGGTEKVLYTFGQGSDGSHPVASLINVNGVLYGTTTQGGGSGCPSGCGTVFSVTATGDEKVLHAFAGGSDGAYPWAELTNVNGTLYGTTLQGGGSGCGDGCGTFFSITTTGEEKVLFAFDYSDGTGSEADLTNVKGTLYGTAGGGANGEGTVISITTSGTENVLHNFAGGLDGAGPIARLINVKGTLYGTTAHGGGYKCHHHRGCGTAFALTP